MGQKQEGTRVLIVDEPDRDLLQVLGTAIDLDPTFLWRHYNEELDSDRYVLGLARLRKDFLSLVATAKKGRAGTDVDLDASFSTPDDDCSIHLRYKSYDPWIGRTYHISCYRISANSCMLSSTRHLFTF